MENQNGPQGQGTNGPQGQEPKKKLSLLGLLVGVVAFAVAYYVSSHFVAGLFHH